MLGYHRIPLIKIIESTSSNHIYETPDARKRHQQFPAPSKNMRNPSPIPVLKHPGMLCQQRRIVQAFAELLQAGKACGDVFFH